MAIGVTDSKHYEAIADVVREQLVTDERYKPEKMADRVGEAINNAYENGIVEGEDQGYDTGYTDGWDFGESSGTHDGFEVGVGFDEDTKSIVCFSGYESGNFDGGYELTIDNPKQLIVTVSKECVFDAFELTDAEGTTHTWDIGILNEGTHTFDIPDGFVCNAEDGYGEVYLQGSCTDYGIVGVSVTNQMSYAEGVEDGKQAEYDRTWDCLQDDGNRVIYHYFFYGCDVSKMQPPKHTIAPTDVDYMFGHATASEGLVDGANVGNLSIDFSKTAITNDIFSYSYFEHLGVLDFSNATKLNYTLTHSKKLHTVDLFILNENATFAGTFIGLIELVNIVIGGKIGNNGINLSTCTKLSHDSLMSFINALKDFSGTTTTRSITFGATNLAKLTDAEKAIATQKGWTLA